MQKSIVKSIKITLLKVVLQHPDRIADWSGRSDIYGDAAMGRRSCGQKRTNYLKDYVAGLWAGNDNSVGSLDCHKK